MPVVERYHSKNGAVFLIHIHLVFVTKYRRRILDAAATSRLREVFSAVCAEHRATIREANGERDHFHLLVDYPPTVTLPSLIQTLKGCSARLLRIERPDIAARTRRGLWSPSYFAISCGGAPIEKIRDYIRSQDAPA